MVNPFLSSKRYDTETAIMLERANVLDIGKAVAYTDGNRIFLNTQDNLFKILPAYNDDMLKWLLWHERTHLELKHHNRFFKYIDELKTEDLMDEFHVTKDEVNIIMDILVHDWMSSKFPELIETAVNNLAQFRDRNSLKYTFKTFTLEEMLDEYSRHKHGDDKEEDGDSTDGEADETEDDTSEHKSKPGKTKTETEKEEDTEPKEEKTEDKKSTKGHAEGGHSMGSDSAEDTEPEIDTKCEQPEPEAPGHHDETDWSKLDDIDSKEFITKSEGNNYIEKINEIKRTKFKLSQITKTLNGLVTTTKTRNYKTPSHMMTGQHTIFKGRQDGKTALYLCFDASGSMGRQMDTFKEIISKSIPQAMKTPTAWFSGWPYDDEGKNAMVRCKDLEGRSSDYYKGKFEDFMHIVADNGYNDDGDRTIELCWKAEQLGYSPIGVTDGGGCISWSKDMLKELKRTVFVGQNEYWLKEAQRINPRIQIINID